MWSEDFVVAEDFVEFEHQKVKSWFDGAKEFIDSVEKVINETERIS